MWTVVIVVVALLVVVGLVLVTRRAMQSTSRRPTRPARRPVSATPAGPVTTVTLDVATSDADSPSVERLVQEVSARTLARDAEVQEVVVVNRDGHELGRVQRTAPPPREVDIPPELHEPHATPRRTPGPVQRPRQPHPVMDLDTEDVSGPHRTLAERFDLPEAVTERLTHPDDPVALVRAILEAAGLPVTASGTLLRTGDDAILVVGAPGQSVTGSMLSEAFLRYQSSGASNGVALCLGRVRASEARRRELLAPTFHYVGPEGIQRMADAVAAGADPLTFVTGFAVDD